jgi:hypothetical protein
VFGLAMLGAISIAILPRYTSLAEPASSVEQATNTPA